MNILIQIPDEAIPSHMLKKDVCAQAKESIAGDFQPEYRKNIYAYVAPDPCRIRGHGHNFQQASIFSEDGRSVNKQVIFCTKCGETKPLEVTEKG